MRRERSTVTDWIVVGLAATMFAGVLGVLILQIQNMNREADRQARELEVAGATVEALIIEVRAQSRLNACLNLKLAKRHGIDTAGLDSPDCKVFPNGAVVFPGAEPGSLLEPSNPGQASPDAGGMKPGAKPGEPPPPGSSPKPQPPPGPPTNPPPITPVPTATCIDLPDPVPDFCV